MNSFTTDELRDWLTTYYLELKDIWGPSYSPVKAWKSQSDIMDFIYYLERQ